MPKTLTSSLQNVAIGVLALLFFSALFGVPPNVSSAQSGLTLRWSADVLVPSGYRGRALPSPGSTITVVAEGIPAALNYVWSVNGTRYNYESGIGNNVFSFEAPASPGITATIDLSARNDRGVVDEASISIPIMSPVVVIRGTSADGIVRTLHNRDTFTIPTGATQFHFQPHFFPSSLLLGGTAEWTIGDQTSTGALSVFTTADFTVSNRSTENIETPLRIDINDPSGFRTTSFLQLLIRGIDIAPSL